MEFAIEGTNNECRFGYLKTCGNNLLLEKTDLAKDEKQQSLPRGDADTRPTRPKPDKSMETPGFLAYTRYGRIPNLTKDVAEYISSLPTFNRVRLCEL